MRNRFGNAFYRSLLMSLGLVVCMVLLLLPIYYSALNSAYDNSKALVLRDIEEKARRLDEGIESLLSVDYDMNKNNTYIRETRLLGDGALSSVEHYSLLKARIRFSELTKSIEGPFAFLWLYRNSSRMLIAGEHKDVTDFSDPLFDQYIRFSGYTKEQLRTALLNGSETVTVLPETDVIFYRGEAQSCFTVVTRHSGSSAVVCALYSPGWIARFFNLSAYSDGASITYADKNGDTVFHTGSEESAKDDVVFSQSLKTLGGMLTVDIPFSYFSDQVSGVLRLIICYFAAALIAGFAVSMIIAIRNYRPIYQIVRAIGPADRTKAFPKDEFAFLSETYSRNRQDLEETNRQVAMMRQSVYNSCLERLLYGYADADELNTVRQYLSELERPCRLALIDIALDREETASERITPTLILLYRNRGFQMIYLGYGQSACLVADADTAQFESCAGEISEAVRRQYGAEAKAVISEAFSDPFQLSGIYQTLQIASVSAKDAVTRVQTSGTKAQKYQTNGPVLLNDAIRSGNTNAAGSVVIMTFRDMVNENCDYRRIADIYESMKGVIAAAAESHNQTVDIPGFTNTAPPSVQFERLSHIAAAAAELFVAPKAVPTYKNDMIGFIDERYTDSGMYAGMVAEAFRVSTKQVYRVVQEMTGVGFSDYVENKRIQHASRLLNTTSEPISEIARQSGFGSVNTFYKSFKRIYGISPSEYRGSDTSRKGQG